MIGEHNPNLTLDEKRSLVIRRGSTRERFFSLGRSMPAPWGSLDASNSFLPIIGPDNKTDRTQVYWGIIEKDAAGAYRFKRDWPSYPNFRPGRDGGPGGPGTEGTTLTYNETEKLQESMQSIVMNTVRTKK